jgi:hypothetical protein
VISNGFVTGPFDKSAAVTSPNWLISIQHNEPALSPPCPKEQPWLLAEVGVASSAEAEAAVAIPVSPNVIAPAATTALNFFKKFGLLAEGERYGCASNEFLKCIVPYLSLSTSKISLNRDNLASPANYQKGNMVSARSKANPKRQMMVSTRRIASSTRIRAAYPNVRRDTFAYRNGTKITLSSFYPPLPVLALRHETCNGPSELLSSDGPLHI